MGFFSKLYNYSDQVQQIAKLFQLETKCEPVPFGAEIIFLQKIQFSKFTSPAELWRYNRALFIYQESERRYSEQIQSL